MIAEIYAAIAAQLRPEVPLFCKRLADGLGFADSPPNSLSFGEHRCRLVAESLWNSFESGRSEAAARMTDLAAAFSRAGLDPLRPFLGVGTGSITPRSLPLGALAIERPRGSGPCKRNGRAGIPLVRIRRWKHPVASGRPCANQHSGTTPGRLCNWVGCSTLEVTDPTGPITPTATALGPDVYSGSAGDRTLSGRALRRDC